MGALALPDRIRILSAVLLYALTAGCGGAAASGAEVPVASDEAPPPAAASGRTESEAGVEAATGDPEAPSDPSANAPGDSGATNDAPREIRYMVRSDGLQVDIEGARFRPRAKAIRVGGGWGVSVSVESLADDDETHSLLRTEHGALAFAGTIRRAGNQEERFVDQRESGEEQLLFPGAPLTLSRDWPGKDGPGALKRGDELRLEVGLWGLGGPTGGRRPVNKFFLVRMSVGQQTPKPLVTPPGSL